MGNTISLGDLVIRLKGDGRDFESTLKKAGKSLANVADQFGKMGKHGLNVLSRNNKEFKELHDTFGDIGIAAGIATDAVLHFTEQGDLGLLTMIKNTEVLGHSMEKWTNWGTIKAQKAFETLASKSKIAGLMLDPTADRTPEIIAENARLKEITDQLDKEGRQLLGTDTQGRFKGYGVSSFAAEAVEVDTEGTQKARDALAWQSGKVSPVLSMAGMAPLLQRGRAFDIGEVTSDSRRRFGPGQFGGTAAAEAALAAARASMPRGSGSVMGGARTEKQFEADILKVLQSIDKKTRDPKNAAFTVTNSARAG